MKQIRFLIQLLILICLVLGFNLSIKPLAKNAPARILLRQIAEETPATDLFLGNSLMEAGFDANTFNLVKPYDKALNISLGATQPAEHYLLLKLAERHPAKRLYYGFFDSQLTDSSSAEWSDIMGNRAIGYFAGLDTVLPFYTENDRAKSLLFHISSNIPLFVDRAQIWNKSEQFRRQVGDIGLPKNENNQFGRIKDFSLLEASSAQKFSSNCNVVVTNQSPLNAPINEILQLSKDRNIQVIFVKMPMPSLHRQRFYSSPEWKIYQTYLSKLVLVNGNKFVDASDWISDEYFADALHLSKRGAAIFTQHLLENSAEF